MYSQIQQCALIAVGRMALHSEIVSKQIMEQEFMPIFLANIEKQNVNNLFNPQKMSPAFYFLETLQKICPFCNKSFMQTQSGHC